MQKTALPAVAFGVGGRIKGLDVLTKTLLVMAPNETRSHCNRKKIFLAMKLTILLLTVSIFQVSASGTAQTVDFKGANVPLEKVFAVIKQQTGLVFFYDQSVLQDAQPVTISAHKKPLVDFLKTVLAGQSLEFSIDSKTITISRTERVPEVKTISLFTPPITGRITDASGNPLVGATIRVKGKNTSTVTGEDGSFTLTADAGSTLIISYIGFRENHFKVTDGNDLTIRMERMEAGMDTAEVVVSTGYQNIPKERATGSFTLIDNKKLNQQVGTNILQRLDGVTSGLLFEKNKSNPGNSSNKLNISIRGLSTINGPLDPLIVVDDFIYEGDIENINPNDVENVTILKDAAAASIWGARAGNGVIVIVTKKGRLNQKLQVDITSNVILSSKPDLGQLPRISSGDYINTEEMLFNNGYFDASISGNPLRPQSPAVEIFLKRRNGEISATDSAQQIDWLKTIDSREEYLKYFYRNPVIQQYSATIRGGTKNNAYTFSAAYDKNIGETYAKDEKLNLRVENRFQPLDRLSIDVGVYFTNRKSSSGRKLTYNSLQYTTRSVPYMHFTDENGNPLSHPMNLKDEYIDTVGGGKLLDWKYYPLEDYKYSSSATEVQDLYARAGISYKINSWINMDLRYQYQRQASKETNHNKVESYATRYLINSFSQIDANTGQVNYIVPYGGVQRVSDSYVQSHTLRAQLNINKSWKNHSVSAIGGTETREAGGKGNEHTVYGYTEDPLSSAAVDFVNMYPTIPFDGYNYIDGQPSIRPTTVSRFVSLFANASYSYKGRYILSGSTRRDGSNIFGANTNDKWKPLYSVGAAWLISEESFYRSRLFPYLKFRTTYGASGNVDLSKTAQAVAASYSGGNLTRTPFIRIRALNNPDLKWEQVRTVNFALEFALKKILSGSVEYYVKKGSDLYGTTPYDYTAWGFTQDIVRNVAATTSRGVDITLNSLVLDKGLKWNVGFLFNYNKSITTKYNATYSLNYGTLVGGGAGTISPIIGKPLYAISAYKWAGLNAAGDPQGYLNGEVSTDYRAIEITVADLEKVGGSVKYMGSTTPLIFGALTNSISFRNFTLSANIIYKFKYYFRNVGVGASYVTLINGGIRQQAYDNRWQKPGDENFTNIPAYQYPDNYERMNFYGSSEINVLKADHIRLQFVNLAYSFTKTAFAKLPFRSVELYCNVGNLGVLWKANKEGLDPDYPGIVSPSRTIAFGVRINY